MSWSRRRLLWIPLGLSLGLAGCRPGRSLVTSADLNDLEFVDVPNLILVGKAWLQGRSEKMNLDRIFEELGPVSRFQKDELLEQLRNMHREDLAMERLELVRGWYLSETELMVCGALALGGEV